jgi:hypothetical protein
MENWLMKPFLEWLEQAEHGHDNERCKMIAAVFRDLWRNQPADALSRQPSEEAVEHAQETVDGGYTGSALVMALEILRLAGKGEG